MILSRRDARHGLFCRTGRFGQAEDYAWFPEIAGTKDVMAVLRNIWANYRDESFISQFLSPSLMRRLRMFHLKEDPDNSNGLKVEAIHNERGYRRVRRELARQYDVSFTDPNIEIVDVDLAGDRRLLLRHAVVNGALLHEADAKLVLQHLADLWSYDVSLTEVNAANSVLKEHTASPRKIAAVAERAPCRSTALKLPCEITAVSLVEV